MLAALHTFEDIAGGVLEGDVDVLNERLVSGDGFEEDGGDAVGICVEKANPFFVGCFDFGEAGEEGGEAVFEAEIFAVTGDVLADEVDFADAFVEEATGFEDEAFEAAAAEVTAELGDDAEGAGVVAAFGDFNVSVVVGGGTDAGGAFVVEEGLDGFLGGFDAFAEGYDIGEFVGAEDGIDFR